MKFGNILLVGRSEHTAVSQQQRQYSGSVIRYLMLCTCPGEYSTRAGGVLPGEYEPYKLFCLAQASADCLGVGPEERADSSGTLGLSNALGDANIWIISSF